LYIYARPERHELWRVLLEASLDAYATDRWLLLEVRRTKRRS
jgi:hypothetical protein